MCGVFRGGDVCVLEEGKTLRGFSSVWQACGRSGMWAHVGRAQWVRHSPLHGWGAGTKCIHATLMLGLMKRDSQLTVTSQPRGRLMATPRCELLASTPHRRTRPVIADTHSFQRTSRLRIFSLTPTAQLDGLHTNGQLRDKHRPAAVKAHGPIPCIVPLTITPLLPINIEL